MGCGIKLEFFDFKFYRIGERGSFLFHEAASVVFRFLIMLLV